jgi:hypothetical protein
MKVSIKRLVAFGSVALVGLMALAGAAGADNYATGLEAPVFSTTWTGPGGTSENPGTVNGQDGWHSATKTDIPALPNGYDQAVVDNSLYPNYVANGGGAFGQQSLRVSNAYTEPSGEFFFQTYSKSTTQNAGEGLANTVYTGEFQFIPTTDQFQPNLYVRVSPDNGTGGRMSFVGLRDVQNGTNDGIQMTFFDTSGDPNVNQGFVGYDLGTYPRDEVHTIKFDIKFVDGPSNDIVRLFVDGTDMGEKLDACFTTWEQFYRNFQPNNPVPVTNSIEFRVQGDGNTIANLVGGGYLFDNVTNTTAALGGPAPTSCGVPEVGVIAPTQTTCSQYRDGTAPALVGGLQYTVKGSSINSVSPGVFFYYTKFLGDEGDAVVVTQTNDGTTAPPPYPAIPVAQGQTVLYDADSCAKLKWGPGFTLPAAPGGNYIVGVKYDASSLKGKPVSTSQPVTYSFETTVGGDLVDTGASVELSLKH